MSLLSKAKKLFSPRDPALEAFIRETENYATEELAESGATIATIKIDLARPAPKTQLVCVPRKTARA